MIYEYYSTIFGSPVQVSYNKHGILAGFTVMNAGEVEKLNTKLPEFKNFYNESDFIAAAKQHGLKITKVERTVTFDMFWEAYKQKDCGRTKGEIAWKALTKTEQIESFDFIGKFEARLKINNTPKPYATTYLNQKRWIQ